MGLDSLKDLLAVIGGVSIIVGPFVGAWLTIRSQRAVATAPAFLLLQGRVTATEVWQKDHTADVKMIPQLALVLERVEEAVRELTRAVREARTS